MILIISEEQSTYSQISNANDGHDNGYVQNDGGKNNKDSHANKTASNYYFYVL